MQQIVCPFCGYRFVLTGRGCLVYCPNRDCGMPITVAPAPAQTGFPWKRAAAIIALVMVILLALARVAR